MSDSGGQRGPVGSDGSRADDIRERIVDHFSYGGERADIWRGLETVLETDRFLNLGYSGRFQSHLLGSPQRRLADRVLGELAAAGRTGPVLDLGCGRGGPAIRASSEYGFEVIGVDLVRYNVAIARERAKEVSYPASLPGTTTSGPDSPSAGGGAARSGRPPQFVVGDVTRLPVGTGSVGAFVAVDSLVYVPDKSVAFGEAQRALRAGGVGVVSDLVATPDAEESRLTRLGAAWDMPAPPSFDRYRGAIAESGLEADGVADLTPHSLGRFRKWTSLFLALAEGPTAPLVDRLLARRGLDTDTVVEQIRAAHDALPDLRHVLVVVRS